MSVSISNLDWFQFDEVMCVQLPLECTFRPFLSPLPLIFLEVAPQNTLLSTVVLGRACLDLDDRSG